MVKKIKKKQSPGSPGWVGVPLVVAVTALAGPRLEGRDVWRPFSPSWRLREVFLDHFSLEIVSTDRPLALGELTVWPGIPDPAWAFRSAGDHGVVLTKTRDHESGEEPQLGIVPIVVRLMTSDVERLSQLWLADFPEIAKVGMDAAFTDAMNLIPGYDRVVWTGPRPARDLNMVIAHLAARVADAFEMAGVTPPRSFGLAPDRAVAAFPGSVRL